MKVLLIGATGFTGSYVLPKLIELGHDVKCLVRPGKEQELDQLSGISNVKGDNANLDSLVNAMQDQDALLCTASLGFGHCPNLIHACKKSGIKKAVFTSTTSIYTKLNAPSKDKRLEAEGIIKSSGLDYTIIRPTMIYGSSRDRNMCRLIKSIRKYPVIFVPGSGQHLMQPVYVGDVANALVSSLSNSNASRESYNISGKYHMSFNQIVDCVARVLNKKVIKIHLPDKPMVKLLKFTEKYIKGLPIKAEQVERLNENKAFDHSKAKQDLNYDPLSFDDGIKIEINQINLG